MKIYRYAKKQFIKSSSEELQQLKSLLIESSSQGHWGKMKSPIDGLDLDINNLSFNKCIGCSWLQVLIEHTTNKYKAKYGYNTYLKEVKEGE